MLTDFHSHILPGVDDGSQDLETSVSMLEIEAKQGIGCVIATPHFYAQHDKPERLLRKRKEAEAILREEMSRHPGLPELKIGAEVYYFNGISDCDLLSELTIDQKRYILIEMPMSSWTDRMYRELENIWIKQGLTPIIAHVDRYIAPFHTQGIPEKLQRLPVMVQANASFFLEKRTKGLAMKLLKQGKIQLLGSDCHNLSDRAPNLGNARTLIEKKLGAEAISFIRRCEEEVLFAP
jgi:protein-tyrosine phosphatase